MRGIRGDRCSSCRRSFSGTSTWEKHFIGQGDNRRCRTVKELRRNGLVRRPDGIWTRRYLPRQLRLRLPLRRLQTPRKLAGAEMDEGTPKRSERRTPPSGVGEPRGAV